MRNRLVRLQHDERGMSFVFVGMGFMAFLAATTLAIDVGMFMTARSQAQNSADAGALSGATALVFDDFDDRSDGGPAKQSAIAASLQNQVVHGNVSVQPVDVTFPNDPSGAPTRVRVQVYRNADRSNAVPTLIGSIFGINTVNITAVATAEASLSNAMTCVKPFTIPDKWIERQTPPWDPDDTYDAFDNKGNPLANPDVYIPADQEGYTGYNPETDRGTRLMIRAGTGNNITPSFYFSYGIGGITGAEEYRWNIGNCNTTIMRWGELLMAEPGDMSGPTMQGIDDLIARDPNAYWNTATNEVVSSISPSPRTVGIPLYDPIYYDSGKRNGRNADLKVANYLGFFIEGRQGNNVIGRITPISGLRDGNGQAPSGAFPRTIRLVE